MSNTSILPKRPEVDTTQTWDLTKLFSDFEDWARALNSLPSEKELNDELERRFK